MRKDTCIVPFPRSYWVVPGLLLAGEFPGAHTEAKAREKLGRLVDVGIRQIINLMQPDETDHSGKPFTGYRQDVQSIAKEKKLPFPATEFQLPI